MRKVLNIIMGLLAVFSIASCNKDFLNQAPKSLYSEDVVWSDPSLVQTFVNNMYRGIGYSSGINFMSSFVDETDFTPDWGTVNFNKCLITPDGIPSWVGGNLHDNMLTWSNFYLQIRSCNVFFSKVGGVKFDNTVLTDGKTQKDRLKGEVFYWRATYYYYLTSLYGGVPIVTKVYGLNDNFAVPRNTYEECINFIAKDLDSAAYYLPNVQFQSGDNLGRVTKGAALALKSRVLLYAASDLHNPTKNKAIATANPELLGYTSDANTARWTAAKDAAKAVMDLNLYSLYKGTPDATGKNYGDIFLLQSTSEDIFVRYFDSKINENWDAYSPGQFVGPNGYHCWGNNCPLQEFVDSYEMNDGTQFDWNNVTMAANPYANRDPRFYASVLYEGASWRQRPVDVVQYDPFNKIQVGQIGYMVGGAFSMANFGNVAASGVDTRQGQIENWNGTYTGYYMKKFIDPTIDASFFKQTNPWRYIRYTEVLLNYAEACIELGDEVNARATLNLIRERVGMPDITDTGAALKARYRNERKIELAFEEQRFFDVRRWLVAPASYNSGFKAQVQYILPAGTVVSTYRKADGSTWGPAVVTKVVFIGHERAWDNKAYFFPIFRDEMGKNAKLVQNPGY
jgi:hypothetical protein